jgi:hypothetical protein
VNFGQRCAICLQRFGIYYCLRSVRYFTFQLDISIHIQNIYCGLWLNRLYLGYSYSGKYTGILTDLFGYNNYFGRIHTEFEDCLDFI